MVVFKKIVYACCWADETSFRVRDVFPHCVYARCFVFGSRLLPTDRHMIHEWIFDCYKHRKNGQTHNKCLLYRAEGGFRFNFRSLLHLVWLCKMCALPSKRYTQRMSEYRAVPQQMMMIANNRVGMRAWLFIIKNYEMHCGNAGVNQGDFCLFMAPQFSACGYVLQTQCFIWRKINNRKKKFRNYLERKIKNLSHWMDLNQKKILKKRYFFPTDVDFFFQTTENEKHLKF